MCTAKVAAVQQIASTLLPYVQQVVNSAEAPAGSSTIAAPTGTKPPSPPPTPPLAQAAAQYDATVMAAAPAEAGLVSPQLTQQMNSLNDQITHEGWASLGSYYWRIGASNDELQKRVDKMPGWSGYDAQAIKQSLGSFDEKRLAGILTAMANGVTSLNPHPPAGAFQEAIDRIFPIRVGAWYADAPASLLLSGDPIANLQRVGDTIMNTEGGLLSVALVVRGAVAAGSQIGSGVPFLAGIINAGGNALKSILKGAWPFLVAIFLALTAVAAVWAYYIPAVPFILWTFGVVGWLILVIEALVASVLWAAGIATPEGEGLIGPKGEQGFQLFLNVMIRPSLMVIGFFASYLLLDSVGNWVGAGIAIFFQSENTGITAWNPLTWISSAVLIAVIAVMLSHKIFALITWVPDNVMRWLGHGTTPLGEHEAEGHTRTAFAGFANSRQKVMADAKESAAGEGGGKSEGKKGGDEKGPAKGTGSASPSDHGEMGGDPDR